MIHYYTPRGFTIVELLVVIAVVAVMSILVTLVLNPAELLRRARDANRISDMATLRTALALYLANVASPNLASSTDTGGYAKCYVTFGTSSNCNVIGFATMAVANSTSSNGGNATSTRTDATGWLPINFSLISSGAPFGSLPIDPVNNGNYFYAYAATSTNFTYKLVAEGMESAKYGLNGPSNVTANDGGVLNIAYEVGTNLQL